MAAGSMGAAQRCAVPYSLAHSVERPWLQRARLLMSNVARSRGCAQHPGFVWEFRTCCFHSRLAVNCISQRSGTMASIDLTKQKKQRLVEVRKCHVVSSLQQTCRSTEGPALLCPIPCQHEQLEQSFLMAMRQSKFEEALRFAQTGQHAASSPCRP